jgi:hypothetical protein
MAGVDQQHAVAVLCERRPEIDEHRAFVFLRRRGQKCKYRHARPGFGPQHAAQSFGLIEMKITQC